MANKNDLVLLLAVIAIGVVCFVCYKNKQNTIERFNSPNADADISQYFSSILTAISKVPFPAALGSIAGSIAQSGQRIGASFARFADFMQQNPNIPNKALYFPILIKSIANDIDRKVTEIIANPAILSSANL